jgi:hypothetical protein
MGGKRCCHPRRTVLQVDATGRARLSSARNPLSKVYIPRNSTRVDVNDRFVIPARNARAVIRRRMLRMKTVHRRDVALAIFLPRITDAPG